MPRLRYNIAAVKFFPSAALIKCLLGENLLVKYLSWQWTQNSTNEVH